LPPYLHMRPLSFERNICIVRALFAFGFDVLFIGVDYFINLLYK
jgi:hypothetical protein